MSDKTQTYFTTKLAGDWVGGKRQSGGKVTLTEPQAETPLRNGEIFRTKNEAEAADAKETKETAITQNPEAKKEKPSPAGRSETVPASNKSAKAK